MVGGWVSGGDANDHARSMVSAQATGHGGQKMSSKDALSALSILDQGGASQEQVHKAGSIPSCYFQKCF